MVVSVRHRMRVRWNDLFGRIRSPGAHVIKSTLAAAISFAVASWLDTSDAPVLAPLTSLLVIQVTLFQTVTTGIQRVASVLAGVLLAVSVAGFVGMTWWSIGGIVGIALLVGLVLRLGPQLNEAAISAMLLLAVGGASNMAIERVYETLVGASVGILLNAVIPPVHLRPAGEAVSGLADRMAGFARSLAGALRLSWSRAEADLWLSEARALAVEVAETDKALVRAEEGARINPRAGATRRQQPRLRTALTGLERCVLALRELCRTLLDRTYLVPEVDEGTVYGDGVRAVLADFLDATADAIHTAGALASADVTPPDGGRIEAHLADLGRHRDRLSELLLVDPMTDMAAWEHHGALLSAVDRLRVELEASTRYPSQPWRPPPLTEPQRQLIRRLRQRQAVRRDGPEA